MSYNSTAYNENYYRSHCGKCYDRGNGWEEIFAKQAEWITKDFQPVTVLDVGCAAGYLVEGLRDLGVSAYGIDISDYALSNVRDDIKPYCWNQSAAAGLENKYDLITCIEVLEHLDSRDVREAVRNMCLAADRIIFSSTPFDYGEETHYSVNQPGYWAELFAANGFFHDIDYDCSYISVQAMVFCRIDTNVQVIVRQYENKLFELWNQCCILRDKNNLAESRIADLDQGNILHAQKMQAQQDQYAQMMQAQQDQYAQMMQAQQDQHAQETAECIEKMEHLQQKHTELMQIEFKNRDMLELKLQMLRAENAFLKEELGKKIGINPEWKKSRDGKVLKKLRDAARYRIKSQRLLCKPAGYWEPVFDAQEYADKNVDIKELFGNDEKKLLRHFILHGMEEGRTAGAKFNIYAYMMCNPDVAECFGNRKRDCFLHYIECGRKEGRTWW
ncbi:MAG: class I SAM-dependent methyltransferase [Eubacterium sp.]|nr:class I SAM-dependent methyltransferase [Eubacterium sp.]